VQVQLNGNDLLQNPVYGYSTATTREARMGARPRTGPDLSRGGPRCVNKIFLPSLMKLGERCWFVSLTKGFAKCSHFSLRLLYVLRKYEEISDDVNLVHQLPPSHLFSAFQWEKTKWEHLCGIIRVWVGPSNNIKPVCPTSMPSSHLTDLFHYFSFPPPRMQGQLSGPSSRTKSHIPSSLQKDPVDPE